MPGVCILCKCGAILLSILDMFLFRIKSVHKIHGAPFSLLLIAGIQLSYSNCFIVGFFSSPKGRQITWDYFKGNFDKVVERFQGGFLLPRVVEVQSLNQHNYL